MVVRLALLFAFFSIAIAVALLLSPEKIATFAGHHHHAFSMHRLIWLSGFFILYTLAFAFIIPIVSILAIALGFLYGFWTAVTVAMTGTVVGAIGLFLYARHSAHRFGVITLGPAHAGLVEKARAHPISFLLSTRFAPLVPFPVAHLVPADAGIRLFDFIWTTIAGTIVATIAFTALGSELRMATVTGFLGSIWLLVSLVALSCAVLLPIAWKHLRTKKSERP